MIPLIPPIPSFPTAGEALAGRYRLTSMLREGAHEARFDATDLGTDAAVSAQILLATKADQAAPLLAGAESARALSGDHHALVLDTGITSEGHPWIITEHVPGERLAEILRTHGALSPSAAVDVAVAICDALAEAHAAGMVHGSLGPHAVTLGEAGVKVAGTGFGHAVAALTIGVPGQVDCIPRAPEQLLHGPVADAQTDVWATAFLLHTMIAGRSPFAVDTPSGASLSVILDEPPALAGVSPELADIVRRSLSRDPTTRPPTILALADALAAFASDPDGARSLVATRRARRDVPTVRRRRSPPPRRHGRGFTALVAAAVCSAFIALALGLVQPARARPASATTAPEATLLPPDLALPPGAALHDPRITGYRSR